MMPPVEVPVIKSKWSMSEIPRSASSRSRRAAAKHPLVAAPVEGQNLEPVAHCASPDAYFLRLL